MSLLFDQNLSPTLVSRLGNVFPGSVHVRDVGLATAMDEVVWSYAAAHHLTIVSKDADFRQLAFLRGFPPKVIALMLGNCSTSEIESLLRCRVDAIKAFLEDAEAALLLLP